MPALELAEEPIPLWWTTDFILASPEGTPAEEEKLGLGSERCFGGCEVSTMGGVAQRTSGEGESLFEEVDRGRVQLLLRGHLQMPAGLLQG